MSWNTQNHPNAMVAPINTNIGGDLQKALNTRYNGDIGETIKRAAENGRINKWAKYKPLRSTTKITPFTEAERKALNQGFIVNNVAADRTGIFHSDLNAAFLTARETECDWNYDAQTGASGEKYRLSDLVPYTAGSSTPFAGEGYKSDALSPFSLVACGQAANNPPDTWYIGCTFYYRPQNIAMTDLDVFNNGGGTWYYGVMYKAGSNAVAFEYLTTTAGGSTKIPVGSTSNDPISGYFTMNPDPNVETVEAYLALACLSISGTTIGYIYAPTLEPATFKVASPVGLSFLVWVPKAFDNTHASITFNTYNTGSEDDIFSVDTRLLFGMPGYSMLDANTPITVTEYVQVNGNTTYSSSVRFTKADLENNYTPPYEPGTFIVGMRIPDPSQTGLPIGAESSSDLEMSVLISVGQETYYVNPVPQQYSGSLPKYSSQGLSWGNMGDVENALGSSNVDYVSIN